MLVREREREREKPSPTRVIFGAAVLSNFKNSETAAARTKERNVSRTRDTPNNCETERTLPAMPKNAPDTRPDCNPESFTSLFLLRIELSFPATPPRKPETPSAIKVATRSLLVVGIIAPTKFCVTLSME